MNVEVQMRAWIPWGKLTRLADGSVTIHPLLDHMIDVASVLEALLDTPGFLRAAAHAAGRPLEAVDIARLSVLAFLHDIGKANTGFQARYWEHARPPGWTIQPCGHGPQGWAVISGQGLPARIRHCVPIDEMALWGAEVCYTLLHASISHHGRPVLADDVDTVWRPVCADGQTLYDPAVALAEISAFVQKRYPLAFGESSLELPNTAAFTNLFAGLVQLADWLGSDTRPGFFPFSTPGENRAETAPQRAQHAVRAIGLQIGDTATRQRVTQSDFRQAFGVPQPRPMQQAVAADGFGRVVVLEAETGSGKTEAALWRFLHLWRAGEVDSLYFALPTRVAATQLHERVRDFVQRVWTKDVPVVVRALPGYTAADGQTYDPLPGFRVLWHDNPEDDEAERRWAAESPKRYLAATIAVGTVDQALLGALQIKHAHLRQAVLSRSLLVVDEVHASDAYMTRLSEHLLRAHMACGGHALLLSATLGAAARTRYLSIGAPCSEALPSLAVAQALPYPAISHRTAVGPALQQVQGNPRHKAVHWETLDIIDEPVRIAELAVDAAEKGARVLVVRNTVPAAIATLKAVESTAAARQVDCLFQVAGVSTLHHSRFSRQDRPLLDAEVQAQIGKLRVQPGGRVVIGTQTLEQSLDIDADLLITDLCPMDVLLQRLGRLHRHERPSAEAPHDHRPSGFNAAQTWVLTPAGHDLSPMLQRQRHGLGPLARSPGRPMAGVYVDLRVLEATRRLIAAAPVRNIPADNRILVECSTHPEALDAIARELGDAWTRFGTECDGALAANKLFASIQALPFDQPFGEQSFPDEEGRVGSRLGAADRLVVFDEPPIGPFGQAVRQLAIRHHLLPRGMAPDAQGDRISRLAGEPGFMFCLGSANYRYSRLGIERIMS